MRLANVIVGDRVVLAAHGEQGFVDLEAVASSQGLTPSWLAEGTTGVLRAGPAGQQEAARLVDEGTRSGVGLLGEDLTFGPPVTSPPRIFAIGRNYAAHAAEGNSDVPAHPMIFFKPITALTRHGAPIIVPTTTEQVDYEGELAVVIGREGREIPEDEALDYVGGYTVSHDVSARDWQRRTSQFDAGKMFDTFAPMGPWLTTSDELPDLDAATIRTTLNGEVMQEAKLGEMIFSVAYLVHDLSRATRLRVGDVIMTGTPAGCGFARTPPVWLQDGDVVSITIDGLGTLTNEVVAAERATTSGVAF
jgi:2-keto-4-pentenoate hydratase/2-oxohepta-3-ene-1,7-dioic acid hydratase in catechol pathway